VKRLPILAAITTGLPAAASLAALAQNAPPSFLGDPNVYKVIFEDENFRVIDSIRKPGVHDKEHGHPVPSIIYYVTDCTTKVYTPDGQTRVNTRKAGTATANQIVASHSAENIGDADCHSLFVERK
jgi:hypothetical protein